MEYPIIDTLTNAYIRNGWTGLNVETGKNVFDINMPHTTGVSTYNYTLTLEPNTMYTCSSNVPYSSVANLYFAGGSSATNGVSDRFPRTFSTDSNGEIIVYVRYLIQQEGTINMYQAVLDGTYWIQVEKGTEATTYEPYKPPTTDIFSRTRLPLIRYFPHPVIDSLQRASDGTMTADDVQVLRHYLTKFGIGNIELGRFHAINPNVSNDIREIDLDPFPIDEPIKEKKKTGEEDLNVKTE